MLTLLNLFLYLIIYLVAILPYWVQYAVAYKLYVLVYYVVGYRKKIVQSNLELIFPKKSPSEIKSLKRKFYRHFVQVFIDTITPLAWSRDTMNAHYTIKNLELLERHLKERSVLLMAGHYANWEWAVSIGNHTSQQTYVVYQPIKNKFFDRLIHQIRSKSNSIMLPNGLVAKTVISHIKAGKKGVYTMVLDQSPMLAQTKLWAPFMGVEVPIHTGAEALAMKANMAVLYIKTQRVKRGYYSVEFEEITAQAALNKPFEITRKFIQMLENQISSQPELYFWTHRRWKHAGKKP